jgi:hypothetical protein
MLKSSRIGPADRSNDSPPAADSSTSTAKQPERLRQRPTHHVYVSFDAPAPYPHAPTSTSTTFAEQPNEFSARIGPDLKDRACVDVYPVRCIYEFDPSNHELFSEVEAGFWRAYGPPGTGVEVDERTTARGGPLGGRLHVEVRSLMAAGLGTC